jgi:predicted LPLAT superfamily acyltransferase
MSKSKTKDWKGVTGGSKMGQKALLFLFHFVNVTVGYVFLALTVPFYMLFGRKGYLSIYHYFKKHFSYSPLKAFFKTYMNHFIFGQCMLDRFAVYAGRKNFFHVEITGNEEFHRLLDEKKGFIIASSHVGNFELSGYLLKQDKKRINALVFGGETEEVMKNRTKALNKNNISVIPVSHDLSHIFKINEALSAGEIVSMPCDRHHGSSKSMECDFLSGKVEFPVGAFTLAAHFDVPVISIFVIKVSVKKYNVFVKPICDNLMSGMQKSDEADNRKLRVEKLTKSYAKELENMLKQYPEQWFNFYEFWK